MHIQVVFAVKFRDNLIQKPWKDELYKFMTASIQNNDLKILQINGMSNHFNILNRLRPTQESFSKVLLFVKNKKTADLLFEFLDEHYKEELCVIHSNKSQNYHIRSIR